MFFVSVEQLTTQMTQMHFLFWEREKNSYHKTNMVACELESQSYSPQWDYRRQENKLLNTVWVSSVLGRTNVQKVWNLLKYCFATSNYVLSGRSLSVLHKPLVL